MDGGLSWKQESYLAAPYFLDMGQQVGQGVYREYWHGGKSSALFVLFF